MARRLARWEMAATDAVALKQFYETLHGWRIQGNSVRCGGTVHGYIFDAEDEIQPFVTVYIDVASLEETLDRVKALGGRTYVPPMPSPIAEERGFAVFGDLDGNIVGLSLSAGHGAQEGPQGARSVGWFELSVTDPEGSAKFYGELFGWEFASFDEGPYRMIRAGEDTIGALVPTAQQQGAPATLYASVDDLAAAMGRATELGAESVTPPTAIGEGMGSYALFRDPAGFLSGLWAVPCG